MSDTVEWSTVLAYLILKNESLATDELYECWYDFNPESHDIVTKIEKLLNCSGPINREIRNREFAALCGASFKKVPVGRNKNR